MLPMLLSAQLFSCFFSGWWYFAEVTKVGSEEKKTRVLQGAVSGMQESATNNKMAKQVVSGQVQKY